MKTAWILLACVAVAGCAENRPRNEVQTELALASPLSKARAVAIQVPDDGSFDGKPYAGSGQQTAAVFRKVFSGHAANVALAKCQGNECERGAGYFVALRILSWEDRATSWSGNRERITIRVTVFDAATDKRVAASILQTSGSAVSAQGPQALLDSLVSDYVRSLY
jgi:Domain of unknown function (DUF4823)